MDTVQRLLAYHEIGDVIGRYCMLFDDQDWDGLADLWTADASFQVEDKVFEPRDVLLDFLRTCLPAGFQSKHMIAPPVIDLADDGLAAKARTDVVWISGNFENTIVARYHDDLVNAGWSLALPPSTRDSDAIHARDRHRCRRPRPSVSAATIRADTN